MVAGAQSPVFGGTSVSGALCASLAASLPSCCSSRAVAGKTYRQSLLSHSLAELCDAALNSPACSLCYKSGTAAFQGARASGARARRTEGNVAPGLCTSFW